MKLTTHRLFAQLCEELISEVSSSLSLVGKNPGGQAVMKQLHSQSGLSHDQDYTPTTKISWSELKDSYRGAWVIIIGSNGTGAIRSRGGNTGNYDALASNGGEVKSATDSRGGNILDFLKREIGTLKQFYVGKNSNKVQDIKKKRADQKQGASGPEVSQDTLVKKFKPLWVKSMHVALADIKGMVGTMIKNDAFEKAKKKIEILQRLEQSIDSIESGSSDVPGFINSAVSSAIYMAASHYYPDQTGDITRSRYGGGLAPTNNEGPKQLLADIAAGDTTKLGTILAFFKRNLISG